MDGILRLLKMLLCCMLLPRLPLPISGSRNGCGPYLPSRAEKSSANMTAAKRSSHFQSFVRKHCQSILTSLRSREKKFRSHKCKSRGKMRKPTIGGAKSVYRGRKTTREQMESIITGLELRFLTEDDKENLKINVKDAQNFYKQKYINR